MIPTTKYDSPGFSVNVPNERFVIYRKKNVFKTIFQSTVF